MTTEELEAINKHTEALNQLAKEMYDHTLAMEELTLALRAANS